MNNTQSATRVKPVATTTTNLTRSELNDWRSTYADTLMPEKYMDINDVSFHKTDTGCIGFNYKNARGLIFPDNGYLGEQPDGRNYYPLLKLSVSYSQECKFNPSFPPNLASAVSAIMQSWKLFAV